MPVKTSKTPAHYVFRAAFPAFFRPPLFSCPQNFLHGFPFSLATRTRIFTRNICGIWKNCGRHASFYLRSFFNVWLNLLPRNNKRTVESGKRCSWDVAFLSLVYFSNIYYDDDISWGLCNFFRMRKKNFIWIFFYVHGFLKIICLFSLNKNMKYIYFVWNFHQIRLYYWINLYKCVVKFYYQTFFLYSMVLNCLQETQVNVLKLINGRSRLTRYL